MTFLAHTDDTITLSSDSQAGKRETTSTQLFVKCPSICGQMINVETVNLARESHDRAIWNCSSCRKLKKKQVKITWHHFVCVQCTHTQGKTCSIGSCAGSCLAKLDLEKKKKNLLSKAKKQHPRQQLIERLKILKTAWILGNGDLPQPWFNQNGSHKILMSNLEAGFAAFAAETSLTLPVGLQKAMAKDFNFGNCMTRFGLDWARAKNKAATLTQQRNNRRTCNTSVGIVFKYNGKLYQDVRNFCNHCDGMKGKTHNHFRATILNTAFPKSAYLVISGDRINNYTKAPADWKNGTRDLSKLKDTAYILGQSKKPTGAHVLLVSREALKQAAAEYWKPVKPEFKKSRRGLKRPAKELDRLVSPS
jgi:hypothetical protein